MDLSNDELEDCVEKFRNAFLKHGSNRRNESDLLLLIENISEEADMCRKNEEILKNKVNCLLDDKNSELTKKYFSLEEKCRKLEIENEEVKSQYEELNTLMKNKLEVQKGEFQQKIEKNLQISNSEINNLKNQIESDKICHESKEKELCNELQVVQAANAIQYDELESNLKRQLVDTNSKLRQAQNVIRTLQQELNNLRSQQQRYKPQTNDILHFQPSPIQMMKNNASYYRQPPNLDYLEVENIEINCHSETFIDRQQSKRQQGDTYLDTTHREATPDRPLSRTTECSSVTKIIEDASQSSRHDLEDEPYKIPLDSLAASSTIPKIIQNEKTNASDWPGRSRIQDEKNFSQSDICDQRRRRYGDNVPVMMHKNRTQKQHDPVTKYSPLPLSAASTFGEFGIYEEDQRNKLQSYAPVLYRGSSNAARKKNNLPPLMPCSDTDKGKKKPQRKRKLYNPDEPVIFEEVVNK